MMSILFALLSSLLAYAIPESNYAQDYQKIIRPFWAQFENNDFKGEKNIEIHFAHWSSSQAARRCLVILPGRSEPIEKYAEFMHSIEQKLSGQFHYFLMDHRGQGLSGRMLEDSQIGYVDQFKNYSLDVESLFNNILSKYECHEKILFAHSMGGGIAVDFVQKNPHLVDRLLLTSPMLKILTKPYSYPVARILIEGFMLAGKGNKYSVGQGPFEENQSFASNNVTHSEVRFKQSLEIFAQNPKTKLGGASNRWIHETMNGTKKIRNAYSEVIIPTLLFTAGDEQYSNAQEMIKFCQEAASCKNVFFQNARHEIAMESDSIRDLFMSEVLRFLK
ncbi:MAG: alpha/beta fold hydrolase [Bacteriovoracaceae bacterium]|nr:alpha/beta fold hydrolase [Bacteriovoracaceae bacterium]